MKNKKSNSIDIIKDIYSKHSKKFLNYTIDVINSIKLDNAVINIPEINEFIFNNVLRDVHLSKYSKNRIFNLVNVDIIPESYTSYGEDAGEIEDSNVDETEVFEDSSFTTYGNRNSNIQHKVELSYNEELATDLWSKIMIYGGIQEYQSMINKIIDDVEKINENAAKNMKL